MAPSWPPIKKALRFFQPAKAENFNHRSARRAVKEIATGPDDASLSPGPSLPADNDIQKGLLHPQVPPDLGFVASPEPWVRHLELSAVRRRGNFRCLTAGRKAR